MRRGWGRGVWIIFVQGLKGGLANDGQKGEVFESIFFKKVAISKESG